MNAEFHPIGKVVHDLIRKTREDEIRWLEVPLLYRWDVTVGSLKFSVENLQDEPLRISITDIKATKQATNGEEVLAPKLLACFSYKELPQLNMLMGEIQLQEERSPIFQERRRELERESQARAEQQRKIKEEAARKIAQRYFVSKGE